MLVFPNSIFAKADGPPPVIGPINPATLFGAGEKGGYYNFTDGASLAVNADGTGGVPGVGAECRSALDLSPNGNRLRNTVNAVTRRVNGIETAGANYGLFNFAGFGDWPSIPQPFELVACIEQIAFAGTDARALAAGTSTPWYLLQGSASGKMRFFDSVYGTEVAPGLGTEFVIDGYFSGANTTVAINGGAMIASTGNGQPLNGIFLGSDSGGNVSTQIRFKHLLAIGRALTAAERSGVVQWMQA